MRIIKFRAWDSDNKELIQFEKIRILPDETLVSEIFEGERYIWIPFIGLHDKNGKEIYEGDIFKSILNSLGNELINPKLVYEELRWVLKDNSKNRNFEYLDYYEADTELEVVGNIYEHSHLIDNN